MCDKKITLQNMNKKIQDRLRIEANFIDPSEYRINMEPLWQVPCQLTSSLETIEEFLSSNGLIDNYTAIAVADALKTQFGIFPHASILANKHQKSLLIWKERADYLRGRNIIFGIPSNANGIAQDILILQDIILGGYTIVKMLADLHNLHRNGRITIGKVKIATIIKLANNTEMENMITLISKEAPSFDIGSKSFVVLLDLADDWSEVIK